MSATKRDPRTDALDLLFGFMKTQCVTSAVRLGVLDRVDDAPRDAASIARDIGANADAVHRLLRALASLGVVDQIDAERFVTTPLARVLSGALGDYAAFFGEDCYPMWTGLSDAVRSGVCAWEARHGEIHFASLARDPEANGRFHRAMASSAAPRIAALAARDWSGSSVVVDIGGGNGALLRGILAAHPRLRGAVFDLPNAIASESRAADDTLGRLTRVAGDIFRDAPPEADTYLLSRVLHDWNDGDASKILRSVRRGAPAGSRLVVVEHVLPNDRPGGARAHMLDLQMLVMTGGRERDEREWKALLAANGFVLEKVAAGEVSYLEARAE